MTTDDPNSFDPLKVGYDRTLANATATIADLTTQVTRLREAGANLVQKVKELEPDINGLIGFAHNHGGRWPADKNWAAEIKAMSELLQPQDPQ